MNTPAIKLSVGSDLPIEQVVELYNSVGWLAYTNDEQRPHLLKATQNSTYVVTAWDENRLVGLAR